MSLEEDAIWHDLVKRQLDVINDRACDAYLHGLTLLDLPLDRVPTASRDKQSAIRNNRLAGTACACIDRFRSFL